MWRKDEAKLFKAPSFMPNLTIIYAQSEKVESRPHAAALSHGESSTGMLPDIFLCLVSTPLVEPPETPPTQHSHGSQAHISGIRAGLHKAIGATCGIQRNPQPLFASARGGPLAGLAAFCFTDADTIRLTRTHRVVSILAQGTQSQLTELCVHAQAYAASVDWPNQALRTASLIYAAHAAVRSDGKSFESLFEKAEDSIYSEIRVGPRYVLV